MRSSLGIVLHPSPVLRRVSRAVGRPDRAVLELARAMAGIMGEAGGIGLAAIQVGVPLRMFVGLVDELDADAPTAFIDPEITWASPATRPSLEGCLSIAGGRIVVDRHVAVRVGYTAADGARREASLSGLMAAMAQHEIDHLDGRLILDRALPPLPPMPSVTPEAATA
jgi:peptide deformylase